MNLEEIINAAVEKRIGEIVHEAVTRRERASYAESGPTTSTVDGIIMDMVRTEAAKQVQEHRELIRAAIARAIEDVGASLQIDSYVKINLNKGEVKR